MQGDRTPILSRLAGWVQGYIQSRMNPLDSEPMMSLDKFIEQTGLSAVTVWRYRKKGMLATVNICGRQYILRAEVARFNERGAAGEFAKPPNHPQKSRMLARI